MIQLQCEVHNRIARLDSFLRAWDASGEQAMDVPGDEHASRSEFGNINVGAHPWTAASLLLPRGHAEFYRHVEPGIRPWVQWFIANGYTTYTSCEGHDYGPGRDPDLRHVGILLRTDCERAALLAAYLPVSLPEHAGCELAYLDHFVDSRDGRYAALDLFLIARDGKSPGEYFAGLDQATDAMLAQLVSR